MISVPMPTTFPCLGVAAEPRCRKMPWGQIVEHGRCIRVIVNTPEGRLRGVP